MEVIFHVLLVLGKVNHPWLQLAQFFLVASAFRAAY